MIFILSVSAQTPETPVLVSVNVDWASKKAVVNWSVSDPTKIDGYIVFRKALNCPPYADNEYHAIDTVWGNVLSFKDTSVVACGSQPFLHPESYRVQAIKGNQLSLAWSNEHKTIFVSSPQYDQCANSIKISWTKYVGWDTAVNHYEVYYQNDLAKAPVFLAVVKKTDTSYTHLNPPLDRIYYYSVKAVNDDKIRTSISNYTSIFNFHVREPNLVRSNSLNVLNGSRVSLSYTVDSTIVATYELMRSIYWNFGFTQIAKVVQPKSATLSFNEPADTEDSIYYYKLQAIDSCGHLFKTSSVMCNILVKLNLSATQKATNVVNWNAFMGWTSGTQYHNIYRISNDIDLVFLDQIPGKSLIYDDDVSNFANNTIAKGKFCYQIEAVSYVDTIYGINRSRSNVACIEQPPLVFAPNAFNPKSNNSINTRFIPYVSFVDNYTLMIFNRWGLKIYETTNSAQGWDGTLPDKSIAPVGSYIYYLRYYDSHGYLNETRGMISVVY